MNTQREGELLAIVSDQSKAIARLADELIGLKAFYDRIINLPDCNSCGASGECAFMPKWGDNVRINCPHWKKQRPSTEVTK